ERLEDVIQRDNAEHDTVFVDNQSIIRVGRLEFLERSVSRCRFGQEMSRAQKLLDIHPVFGYRAKQIFQKDYAYNIVLVLTIDGIDAMQFRIDGLNDLLRIVFEPEIRDVAPVRHQRGNPSVAQGEHSFHDVRFNG